MLPVDDIELWLVDLAPPAGKPGAASRDAVAVARRQSTAEAGGAGSAPASVHAAVLREMGGSVEVDEQESGSTPSIHRAGGRERTAAHAALRWLLARHVGAEEAAAPFVREAAGRPLIASRRVDFSLSHAAGRALVGIVRHGRIGVDLEAVRPARIGALRRLAIEAHAAGFARAPLPEEADRRFVQSWVRLESVAKFTGEGIGRLLDRARECDRRGLAPDDPRGPSAPLLDTMDPRPTVWDLELGARGIVAACAAFGIEAMPPVRRLGLGDVGYIGDTACMTDVGDIAGASFGDADGATAAALGGDGARGRVPSAAPATQPPPSRGRPATGRADTGAAAAGGGRAARATLPPSAVAGAPQFGLLSCGLPRDCGQATPMLGGGRAPTLPIEPRGDSAP